MFNPNPNPHPHLHLHPNLNLCITLILSLTLNLTSHLSPLTSHLSPLTFTLPLTLPLTVDRVVKSSAVFDMTKLKWINGQHIRIQDNAALQPMIATILKEVRYASVVS